MRNVDVFFRVLERFNDFESKKYGYIKNVEIIVFKNEKGYNIYFGLRNNDCLFFGEQVVRGEQNFVHNGINKAFLPNTGVYLENVSEEELDTILFVFNKKYSATLGFFDSLKKIYNKSKIDTFSTSPELELYTTIWIDKNNSPLNINKHLLGSKDAYSKIMLKTAAIRKSEIWYNAKVDYNEYVEMLKTLKNLDATDYLALAYKLPYYAYFAYLNDLGISTDGLNSLVSASEFLKR